MFTHMTGHNNIPHAVEWRRSHETREYGRNGIFGIMTPQGNPTVEAELGILLPAGSVTVATRLISPQPTLRDRLLDYLQNLPVTVASYGGLTPDIIGFACTGSSYLVEPEAERRIIAPIEAARNCRIVTAAQAVKDACLALGLRRLALISPYPHWLTNTCRAHWERQGLTVTAVLELAADGGDKHGIYELTTASVLPSARTFQTADADAILVTGTGMPSLRTILALGSERTIPVLSSNLCLAWALTRGLGVATTGSESRLYGGWRERLAYT